MTKPTLLALTKPEEGVRSPEIVDDSKLLGVYNAIQRFQLGELDSTTLAHTLDTFASVIRQIMFGENSTGSYLRYPPKSIEQIVADVSNLTSVVETNSNTIVLTASETVGQFSMVKLTGPDQMGLAQANNSLNAGAVGCMLESTKLTGEPGIVAVSGKRIQGILSGATFNTKYYLDPTIPGGITTVIPLNGVQLEIGRALNATDLLLDIKIPMIRH